MAQSGYTPILIYGSGTAGNTPSASNLTSTASGAELALNYADGKLFYKDSGGTVQVLATKGTGPIGGSNTQIQFNNSGVLGGSASLTWDGTYLTANSIKNSALTSTRITFAGASGLLSDSANLTWSGTVLSTTGFTASSDSSFTSTGALTISKGNTAARPVSATSGMLRFNTQTSEFEGYNGTTWASVGGAAISNDTSTSTNVYPLFANATSGTATTVYTSNDLYLYKPSTGELSVKAPVASNGIFVNSTTVSSNYTIASGYNGQSIGPMTVASGVTVTVASGQRWVVQ